MKKSVFRLLAAGALCLACSCDDNDGDYAAYTDFVTVRTTAAEADYYFLLDDGKTLYPGDRDRIGVYEAVDGPRAQLFFSLLPETEPGYDYSAAIYEIRDIYTGHTRLLTVGELALLPDDATSLHSAWLRKNYLTLQIAYPVTDNSKHNFVLACVGPEAEGGEAQTGDSAGELAVASTGELAVVPDGELAVAPAGDLVVAPAAAPAGKQSGEQTNAGYLEVELRHDAAGDTAGENRVCCISFPLEPLGTLMQGKKGLSLRVRTQYNGTKNIQIDMQ